jgi:hypothetical protein
VEEPFLPPIECTLNILAVNDVTQTELHRAEPLVCEPSAFEVQLAIEKLKSHKAPGIDQIPVELLKAGGEQLAMRSMDLLRLVGIRRNCLRSGRSRSLYLSIIRTIKQLVVIVAAYLFVNYVQNFIQHPAIKFTCICTGNYWGSLTWISTQQTTFCLAFGAIASCGPGPPD